MASANYIKGLADKLNSWLNFLYFCILVAQSKKTSGWKANRQELESRTRSELSFISKNALEYTTREVEDTLGLGAF